MKTGQRPGCACFSKVGGQARLLSPRLLLLKGAIIRQQQTHRRFGYPPHNLPPRCPCVLSIVWVVPRAPLCRPTQCRQPMGAVGSSECTWAAMHAFRRLSRGRAHMRVEHHPPFGARRLHRVKALLPCCRIVVQHSHTFTLPLLLPLLRTQRRGGRAAQRSTGGVSTNRNCPRQGAPQVGHPHVCSRESFLSFLLCHPDITRPCTFSSPPQASRTAAGPRRGYCPPGPRALSPRRVIGCLVVLSPATASLATFPVTAAARPASARSVWEFPHDARPLRPHRRVHTRSRGGRCAHGSGACATRRPVGAPRRFGSPPHLCLSPRLHCRLLRLCARPRRGCRGGCDRRAKRPPLGRL